MADDHLDVTINDSTKISLGWFVAGLGFSITLVTSIVLWASRIADSSAATAKEVISVKQDVNTLKDSVEKIREAQIRMETKLGYQASYEKNNR